mmetsp:Transcript_6180/g.15875  ORF Transcript_6180/g.15875 Transcript_6180/m.15875 type:complete len:617 (+) Transcript_6180:122-1972(+)
MLKESPVIGVLVGVLLVGFAANMYHLRSQYSSVKEMNIVRAPRALHGNAEGMDDLMLADDDATMSERATVGVVFTGSDGVEAVSFPATPQPTPRAVNLPVWLSEIAHIAKRKELPQATIRMPRTRATTLAATTTPAAATAPGWPMWQTLPEACNPSKVQSAKPMSLQEFVRGKQERGVDITEVKVLGDLPKKYYTRQRFTTAHYTALPKYLPGALFEDKAEQLFARFKNEQPNSFTLFCFPHGIGVDNSPAGPLAQPDPPDEGDNPVKKFMLHLNQFWYAKPHDVASALNNNAKVIDVPGMVVMLTGWTTFVFNHFSLDSMIRLSMIIDRLKSDDPLWGTAKILAAVTPIQEKNPDGSWRAPKAREMKEGAYWVWQKAGLADRIIPGTGWAARAVAIYRAEYLVLADVYPHPTCGGMNVVRDPWFPRGALEPLQRHLGVFEPGIKRNLVIWAGRAGGMRALDMHVEREIQKQVMEAMRAHNKECPSSELQFEVFSHEHPNPNGGRWHDFELFRRAVMVLGPHGQQLWNHAFARPGTVVIEFTSLTGLDAVNPQKKDDDCRHCGWALANAAGHNYWIEEPEKFSFFLGGIKPNKSRVMRIVNSAFQNMTRECRNAAS